MTRQQVSAIQGRPTKTLAAGCCALALAAAIVLALCLPDPARASCGDYVFVRDASGKLVPASELAAGNGMTLHDSTAPAPVPCQGPACSQRRHAPPAAPPVPIVWPSSPEGLLAALGDASDRPQSDRGSAETAPIHAIHHPGRVFRPPRTLARV